jgi:hypothetical protein
MQLGRTRFDDFHHFGHRYLYVAAHRRRLLEQRTPVVGFVALCCMCVRVQLVILIIIFSVCGINFKKCSGGE